MVFKQYTFEYIKVVFLPGGKNHKILHETSFSFKNFINLNTLKKSMKKVFTIPRKKDIIHLNSAEYCEQRI